MQAAAVRAATAASGGASGNALSSNGPISRPWKIEAMFEMSTSAPVFRDEYESSVAGVALTLADRLVWATDVPLSRFAFWLPDAAATVDAENVIFCDSSMNERSVGAITARWASSKNATYKCAGQKHKLNSSMPVLLQRSAGQKKLTFEVGVFPPSGVDGDTKPGVQVAEEVVKYATSGDAPERKLHKNGLWTYKAGPGVRFQGLFPATFASLAGTPFAPPRETSLPLGPNPGGHGAEPPVTPPPGFAEDGKKQETYLTNVDAVVHEANEVNNGVKASLQELKDSLARASAAHAAWMNMNAYKLPDDLVR